MALVPERTVPAVIQDVPARGRGAELRGNALVVQERRIAALLEEELESQALAHVLGVGLPEPTAYGEPPRLVRDPAHDIPHLSRTALLSLVVSRHRASPRFVGLSSQLINTGQRGSITHSREKFFFETKAVSYPA